MSKSKPVFELTHPNAAGIDIGASSHFVAVPPDRDGQPVREFPSFTVDLERLAGWLAECGVDTVAMESTGVYWIPLFELLESRGFTVYLVNARHVKNVSGRKSDVQDCQWLQQLMSFGLLSGAFCPKGDFCSLRCVARQREMLIAYQSRHIQHMQKALTQMNIQLGQVISDVAGETGLKIIRAILGGERDGQALAKLKNGHIRASEADIALVPARQLARGASVRPQAGGGPVRRLRPASGRVRPPVGEDARGAGDARGPAQGTQAASRPGEERPGLRPAHLPVPVVRGGFDAHRRHRRHHRVQGAGRGRRRPLAVQERQAFRLVAGPVPGDPRYPGAKSSRPRPSPSPTAPRRPCAWRRPACAAASRPWAPTTAGSVPEWTSPAPSPPAPTSWPG